MNAYTDEQSSSSTITATRSTTTSQSASPLSSKECPSNNQPHHYHHDDKPARRFRIKRDSVGIGLLIFVSILVSGCVEMEGSLKRARKYFSMTYNPEEIEIAVVNNGKRIVTGQNMDNVHGDDKKYDDISRKSVRPSSGVVTGQKVNVNNLRGDDKQYDENSKKSVIGTSSLGSGQKISSVHDGDKQYDDDSRKSQVSSELLRQKEFLKQRQSIQTRYEKHGYTLNMANNKDRRRPPSKTSTLSLGQRKLPTQTSKSYHFNINMAGNKEKGILIIPEYKLVFCAMEKVGCAMFNHLFRMLRLHHPSMKNSIQEAKFLAKYPWGRLHLSHFNMTYQDYLNILEDKRWTKAMFYRDPAIRFLSAFRSKCGRVDADGQKHCEPYFGQDIRTGSKKNFQLAFNRFSKTKSRVFTNPHYAPQAFFCGGLNHSVLEKYDYVEKLNPKTTPDIVRKMFQDIGVDPVLIENLIETVVKTGGRRSVKNEEDIHRIFNITLKWDVINRNEHSTHSDGNTTLIDYFQNDEFLRRVQETYRVDYELFQIEAVSLKELSE